METRAVPEPRWRARLEFDRCPSGLLSARIASWSSSLSQRVCHGQLGESWLQRGERRGPPPFKGVPLHIKRNSRARASARVTPSGVGLALSGTQDSELVEPGAQRSPGYTEELGRLRLVAAALCESKRDPFALAIAGRWNRGRR